MTAKLASSYRKFPLFVIAAGLGLAAMAPLAAAETAYPMGIGGDNPSAVDEALDTIFCSNDFSADGCRLALLVEERPAGVTLSRSPATALPAPAPAETIEAYEEDYEYDDEGC